ncbi:MAG: T9SS type A sorting domain-containing protein [Tannerella sp.]|jgi:hypothetical protein|nr:T9SS type A sorting domain-containing protein [Tannerella sp.]
MKTIRLLLSVSFLCAFTVAISAQSVTGNFVKIRYPHSFSDSAYWTDNLSFEVIVTNTSNPQTFNIDSVGSNGYVIIIGTAEKSGEYIKGRFLFDDNNFTEDAYGPGVTPYPADNSYFSGLYNSVLHVNAIRKGDILYVIEEQVISDYSKLESLVAANKVKKIDLTRKTNFLFDFIYSEERGGYEIQTGPGLGIIGVSSARGSLISSPVGDAWGAAHFLFESEQGISAEVSEIRASRGSLDILLDVPEGSTFKSAKFDVTLPDKKFTVDEANTVLANDLKNSFSLQITPKSNNVWSFDITSKDELRSSTTQPTRKAVHVAYEVEKGLADGVYSFKISDLELVVTDDLTIGGQELVIPVTFSSETGNETLLNNSTQVWASGKRLYIRAVDASAVNIYNVTGAMVKTLTVADGETSIPLPAGIYFVKTGMKSTKVIVR